MALLSVQEVSVRFGGIVALDCLSLPHRTEGRSAGSSGRTAPGKTTMFNVVSRIYQPTVGSITFDGNDLLDAAGRRASQARHRPHVPEPGAVAGHDGAGERDGRRPHAGPKPNFVTAALRIGTEAEETRARQRAYDDPRRARPGRHRVPAVPPACRSAR